MARAHLGGLLNHIRRLAGGRECASDDTHLLERFLSQRDENAFAILMERYGPMVLGVCRRTLRDEHDAEDAFQAAFVVLARKAASIRRQDSLGSWLYGVAFRIAARLRQRRERDQARRREVTDMAAKTPAPSDIDLRPVLDEEIQGLPERYRQPIVLCYLEGKTNDEAARHLGCPVGTVSGRLTRARQQLRGRLERRGVTVSAAAIASFLAEGLAPAAVSPGLAASTLAAAAGPSVPAAVVPLVEGALREMTVNKFNLAAALLVGIALLGAGTGLWAYHNIEPARPSEEVSAPEEKAAPGPAPLFPLPPEALLRIGTPRFRHQDAVTAIAYSPDGKTIVTGSSGKMLHFWDTRGRELGRYQGPQLKDGIRDSINAFAFTPDSKYVVLCCHYEQRPRLIEVATAKEVRQLAGDPLNGVIAVAVSPNGKLAAAAGGNGKVQLWNLESGRPAAQCVGHTQAVFAVAFTPDGRTLASGSTDKTIRLWEVASGKERGKLEGHTFTLKGLIFSPDGKQLHSAGMDHRLCTWDWQAGKKTSDIVFKEPFTHFLFSPDAKLVWAGGEIRNEIRVLDVATGKDRFKLTNVPGAAGCIAFSPDSKALACGSFDRTVRICDVEAGKPDPLATGHWQQGITSTALSPDGTMLASVSTTEPAIRLWDPATGRERGKLAFDAANAPYWVGFSPDGKRLASMEEVDPDNGRNRLTRVRLWDTATRKELRHYQGTDVDLMALTGLLNKTPIMDCHDHIALARFTPDSKALVLLGQSRVVTERTSGRVPHSVEAETLRVWDLDTGKTRVSQSVLLQGEHPRPSFTAAAIAPDGKSVITAKNGKLRPWEIVMAAGGGKVAEGAGLVAGKLGKEWALPRGPVSALAYSADGRTLASVTDAGPLLFWEVATGKESRRGPIMPGGQTCLLFSPDGATLLSGHGDGTLRIWEAATGKMVQQVKGHQDAVTSLGYATDGKRIVSGSGDSTILIWDVERLLKK